VKPLYVFVTVGAPACGKSSFYHKISAEDDWGMSDTPAYISSDDIREELFGTAYDQSDPSQVFALVNERAESYLAKGVSVYLDATHAKYAWRLAALNLAHRYSAVCVALHFRVPLWTLIKRDRRRTRHVGFWTLVRYYFGLQEPCLAEGFDAVFCVGRDGQFGDIEW